MRERIPLMRPAMPAGTRKNHESASARSQPDITARQAGGDHNQANLARGIARDFSSLPVHPSVPRGPTNDYVIAQSDDGLEQEVDASAERVLRTPRSPGQLPIDPGKDQALRGHRQSAGRSNPAPPSVQDVLGTSGEALSPAVRAPMERHFGYNLSRIRVHSDLPAARSARRLGARAYTAGEHIVFGSSEYAPQTTDGRLLLAHELTHSLYGQEKVIHCKPDPVKIGRPTLSTEPEQAKAKAKFLADKIRSGRWDKLRDPQQLAHWLEFFEGRALYRFVSELEELLGEKINEFKRYENNDVRNRKAFSDLIVPLSQATPTRGGFKVSYFAQVIDEDSTSETVEVYTDTSGGAGIGLDIPIKKVVKVKLSADIKKGRKKSEKEESKYAKRKGRTISRSFEVQKYEREAFQYTSLERFIGGYFIGDERLGFTLVGAQTERELAGWGPVFQHGFQIVPEEGGSTWGPFWNDWGEEGQAEGSALQTIWGILDREQRKIAEDVVLDRDNTFD